MSTQLGSLQMKSIKELLPETYQLIKTIREAFKKASTRFFLGRVHLNKIDRTPIPFWLHWSEKDSSLGLNILLDKIKSLSYLEPAIYDKYLTFCETPTPTVYRFASEDHFFYIIWLPDTTAFQSFVISNISQTKALEQIKEAIYNFVDAKNVLFGGLNYYQQLSLEAQGIDPLDEYIMTLNVIKAVDILNFDDPKFIKFDGDLLTVIINVIKAEREDFIPKQ